MAVFKRGKNYWFKYVWRGEQICKTTKQSNKQVAKQMEAADRTARAKGEVGIIDRKPTPTLKSFLQSDFKQHVETTFMEKATTRAYYRWGIDALCEYRGLADCRMDAINDELLESFKRDRREAEFEVSTINRTLAILRRALMVAFERGVIRQPIKVTLLPKAHENHRERVLTEQEREAYLAGARTVGDGIIAAHQKALAGIRATQRGEQPIKPQDPYLLYDVAVILMETALRPEEAYRLRWEHVTDEELFNPHGKTKAARRTVPVSPKARAILKNRREVATGEWVFPAATKSGHVDVSTLRKQHVKACTTAEIEYFELYIFRHTTLTEWARFLDFYTLKTVAGHSHHSTTERYVHRAGTSAQREMRRMWQEQQDGGRYKSGYSSENAASATAGKLSVN